MSKLVKLLLLKMFHLFSFLTIGSKEEFRKSPKGVQYKLLFLFISFLSFQFAEAQTLGVYEFTGFSGCSNTSVSTQPTNASFSSFSSTSTNCSFSSLNIFRRTSWNTSSSINTSEYNEFSLTADAGYDLNLASVSFKQYVSWNSSTTWILRSSLDNYASNIETGDATTTQQTSSVNLPSNFAGISTVTFRLYVLSCNSSITSWTNDNVEVIGTVGLACTTPATPSAPTSNSPQCASPGVTITKVGTPPTGVSWYWQTTVDGTSTANNASSDYTATTSGTYYIRAQDDTDGCWSATSGSVAVTINTSPSITLGANTIVCTGITSSNLAYSGATNSPDLYSIDFDATAEAQGFLDITEATLPASPIVLTVPAGASSGEYNYTVTVKNSTSGCAGAGQAKTITINTPPTVNAGGPNQGIQSESPAPITLIGASFGGEATTAAWSIVSGGGSLSSTAQTANPENVTYTPAVNYSGGIVLTLTTNTGACGAAATANRTINISPATSNAYTTAGTHIYSVPSCITELVIETWGAGGGAGGSGLGTGGNGGGGGAYSQSTITVIPGTDYNLQVGAAGTAGPPFVVGGVGEDSWFWNSTVVLAKGGSGGASLGTTVGEGGNSASGVGTLKYSGGNGGLGDGSGGGGGGSSAGTGITGNNGQDKSAGGAGGAAPTGGGAGADGSNSIAIGSTATELGGGGAGGGSYAWVLGGAGAAGKVVVSWVGNLSLSDNSQSAANICPNALDVPLHSFQLIGSNACATGLAITTTGDYTASEIASFKLYYTTTNTFATTNLLASIAAPAGAGAQTFPAFSLPISSIDTFYVWVTMDAAGIVTDGHSIAVNGTSPSDITSSILATGNASGSGEQTFRTSFTNLTWTGALNSDWSNVSNWAGCALLSNNTNITIPAGVTNMPEVSAVSDAICNSITIDNAATLTLLDTAKLNIYGDWTNNGNFISNNGSVVFKGVIDQHVNEEGALFNSIIVDKTAGLLIIDSIINISTKFILNLGIVEASNGFINMLDNSIIEGGSDSSFVSGIIQKVGDDAFVFPLGDAALTTGAYHPISISQPASVTDAFSAQYIASNQTYGNVIQDDTLEMISNCEHWILNRTSGTSIVTPSLSWNTNSCNVGENEDLRIASWDGSQWTSMGVDQLLDNGNVGTITAAAGFDFNSLPIALARYGSIAINTTAIEVMEDSISIYTPRYHVYGAQNINEDQEFETFIKLNHIVVPDTGTTITMALYFDNNEDPNYDTVKIVIDIDRYRKMSNVRYVNNDTSVSADSTGIVLLDNNRTLYINNDEEGVEIIPDSLFSSQFVFITDSSNTITPNNDGYFDVFQVIGGDEDILPEGYSLRIYRSSDSSAMSIFESSSIESSVWDIKDASGVLVPNGSYTYEIIYNNEFTAGVFSVNYEPIISVQLQDGLSITPDNDGSYDDFRVIANDSISNYTIEIYGVDSTFHFYSSNINETWDARDSLELLVPVGLYYYNISYDSISVIDSFLVEYPPPLSIVLDSIDAITPNGDGINDSLVVSFDGVVDNYQLFIVDSSDSLVFETEVITNFWDGKDLNNQLVSVGNYHFIIICNDQTYQGLIVVGY